MSEYRDFEPEDEYDATDPVNERLRVIIAILAAARSRDGDDAARKIQLAAELLRKIAAVV